MYLLNKEVDVSISLNNTSFDKAKNFRAAGFTSAEFCFPTYFQDKADFTIYAPTLKKAYPLIKDSDLKIASYHIPFGTYWDISSPDEAIRQGAIRAVSHIIDLVEDYEGTNLVLHPSAEPISDDRRDEHILACQQSLEALAPIAQKRGKKIALENLPRTCLGRTSKEMALITKEGSLCGICMDTTHLFHETPQDFLARCGKWVINTHLSDYLNGQDECHWVPGTGSLNWREIFEGLFALNYTGTYNFEVSNYAPLEIIGGLKNALVR